MTVPVSDIAFTPAVKAVQERMGSRRGYAAVEARSGWADTITPELAAFIAERNSFYLGTASAAGRPYIQHRGGPSGFLKVLDDRTLAFADYSGNRQYISVGNLSENDQAFLFLMDYPNRRRVKIWGRAEVVEDDVELLERLAGGEDGVQAERAFVFHVEAWDVNCPKHITPRFRGEEIDQVVRQLRDRIAQLEAEITALTPARILDESGRDGVRE
jgi:predicted pyridoxine 5'-phosphate oxidase superfamily flavin-nucleotide-binding protein